MALIKNVEHAKEFQMEGLVDYENGKVVSLTLAQEKMVSMTVFAFDAGEKISTHAAPGDAMVTILDGEAEITIGEGVHPVKKGETIIMPAGVPHGLRADSRFKMLLTVVKM